MAYQIRTLQGDEFDGELHFTKEAARRALITAFWYDFQGEELTPKEINALPLDQILEGAELTLLEV